MKPVDLYILNQNENFRSILFHLIAVVEQNVPEVSLEYKWRIPFFYYKKKPFCFLNASPKGGYVDIAFSKGYQLQQNQDVLIGEKRNTYKSLRYATLEEIDNSVLVSVIEEAKLLA